MSPGLGRHSGVSPNSPNTQRHRYAVSEIPPFKRPVPIAPDPLPPRIVPHTSNTPIYQLPYPTRIIQSVYMDRNYTLNRSLPPTHPYVRSTAPATTPTPPSPSDRFLFSRTATSLPPLSEPAAAASKAEHDRRVAEVRTHSETKRRQDEHLARMTAHMQAEARARMASIRGLDIVEWPETRAAVERGMRESSPIRSRTRLGPAQLDYLEKLWERTQFPTPTERQITAQQLGLTPRQVQVWFQNRRQKYRRITESSNPPGVDQPCTSRSAESVFSDTSAHSAPELYHPGSPLQAVQAEPVSPGLVSRLTGAHAPLPAEENVSSSTSVHTPRRADQPHRTTHQQSEFRPYPQRPHSQPTRSSIPLDEILRTPPPPSLQPAETTPPSPLQHKWWQKS